jgi:hypothetical protein
MRISLAFHFIPLSFLVNGQWSNHLGLPRLLGFGLGMLGWDGKVSVVCFLEVYEGQQEDFL